MLSPFADAGPLFVRFSPRLSRPISYVSLMMPLVTHILTCIYGHVFSDALSCMLLESILHPSGVLGTWHHFNQQAFRQAFSNSRH